MADITAIICEYNPFHKGHKYQLDKVKELYPHTKILSVMSPSFMQRGRPAVFDKFVRGEAAVRGGADLVVSMPQVFALLSAEGFAEGGVRAAKALGATALAFGVEDDEIDALVDVAKILISKKFENEIKNELTLTPELSYPVIRQRVLGRFTENARLVETPNNILAIEYIKAILRFCPDMKLVPIKRCGNAHNSPDKTGDVLSASAIREMMSTDGWKEYLPEATRIAIEGANTLDFAKYNAFLFSALTVADYDRILFSVGNKELADTIFSEIRRKGDYDSFREALSRKRFPETKIDRALLSVILEIGCDEYMHEAPEYATLLAMTDSGREIIKNAEIEIISKHAGIKNLNSKQAEKELFADRIWARCSASPSGEEYFINKRPFLREEVK